MRFMQHKTTLNEFYFRFKHIDYPANKIYSILVVFETNSNFQPVIC